MTKNATLQETKRPSKEMQVSIARQLGLQPSTVGNFFMNARRRLHDKWQNSDYDNELDNDNSGAKIPSENNNNSNLNNTIMIVDGYSGDPNLQPQQQPHDLSFALEAIESIEQPPTCHSDTTEAAVVHAAATASASGVYSLTSL